MRWSYKTVHYELTKEGLLGSTFLDESAVELSLNEYGKAGWELVSMLETLDGLIAVFKQPLSLQSGNDFVPDGLQIQPKPVKHENESTPLDDEYHPVDGPGELESENDYTLGDEFEIIEEEKERQADKPGAKKDIGSIKIA